MVEKPSTPVPTGYHTVTPWIVAQRAGELVSFIERVFGGKPMPSLRGGLSRRVDPLDSSCTCNQERRKDSCRSSSLKTEYICGTKK